MAAYPDLAKEKVMKRICIDWEIIGENSCSGNATVDEWSEDQTYINKPFRSTIIPVKVEKNITSMKNIPPFITEDIRAEITSMMQIFFHGVHQDKATYKWLDLREE